MRWIKNVTGFRDTSFFLLRWKITFSTPILPLLPPDKTRPVGLSFYFASSRMKKVKLTRTPSATCYGLCSRLDHPSTSPNSNLLPNPVEKLSFIESRKCHESSRISCDQPIRDIVLPVFCYFRYWKRDRFYRRLILFSLQLSLNMFSPSDAIFIYNFLFFFKDKFK